MHSGPVLIYCRSASIFFDLDNEIKRTDFLENIFDCYKTKEKQSFVPINFNINAFVGKKSVLGSVDWESRKCSFTDGRFEKTAGYIYDNGVPEDEYKYYLDYPEDSDGYRDYFRGFVK